MFSFVPSLLIFTKKGRERGRKRKRERERSGTGTDEEQTKGRDGQIDRDSHTCRKRRTGEDRVKQTATGPAGVPTARRGTVQSAQGMRRGTRFI